MRRNAADSCAADDAGQILIDCTWRSTKKSKLSQNFGTLHFGFRHFLLHPSLSCDGRMSSALFAMIKADVLSQPNFVQGLHSLLVQSTANDTVQLKAVSRSRLA